MDYFHEACVWHRIIELHLCGASVHVRFSLGPLYDLLRTFQDLVRECY